VSGLTRSRVTDAPRPPLRMALAGATRRCFALLGTFPTRRDEDLRGALGVGGDGRGEVVLCFGPTCVLSLCGAVLCSTRRCFDLLRGLCMSFPCSDSRLLTPPDPLVYAAGPQISLKPFHCDAR